MALSDLWLDSLPPARMKALARYADGPVRTGHAIFDRRANMVAGLHRGNAVTALQLSNYIRAHRQVACNGFIFNPGELQSFDLQRFRASMPLGVMRQVEEMTAEREAVLYQVSHYSGNTRHVHGWICTDVHGRFLRSWPERSPASARILEAVSSHLSWSDHGMEDPIDAAGILDAVAGMDADEAEAFTRKAGWRMARDARGLRDVLPHAFREARPFSAWKPHSPVDTIQRAEDPARLAALVAAREEMSPEAVIGLRGHAPSPVRLLEDHDTPAP